MAYKRYIKIGGKLYGPYEYHSYRDGSGSVKSKYVRKVEKVEHENIELKKKVHFLEISLAILLVFLLALIIFYLSEPRFISGGATFELKKETFVVNETIKGKVKLDFLEGEFYPANAVIKVTLNGQSKNITLDELITLTNGSLEKKEGHFYIANLPIGEYGEGYGFYGYKEVPVDVFFKLLITKSFEVPENVSEENITNITEENITEENITETPEENITEELEENITTEEEIVPEVPSEEFPEEQPEQPPAEQPTETPPEESEMPEVPEEQERQESEEPVASPEVTVTGAAVVESRIVEGKCSVDEPFIYPLENETAELVPESVKTSNKSLNDSEVNISVYVDKVKVTTNYKEKIEGFGEEFLTGNKQILEIDLEVFNLTSDEEGTYDLSLTMVYNNFTIMQTVSQVTFVNVTEEVNVTNETHAPILIEEIPDITIPKNNYFFFDLANYFKDPDNDFLEFSADEVENITIELENSTVIIIPDENFTGTREIKFYASDGENVTESNVVNIDVIETMNYTIKIIDTKGNVIDELSVNESKVKVKINKFEENGIEGFDAIIEYENEIHEREEEQENEENEQESETENETLINETTQTNENETNETTEINETNETFELSSGLSGLAVSDNKNKGSRKDIYNSTIDFIVLPSATTIQIDKPSQTQQAQGIATEILAIEPSEDIEIGIATITLEKLNNTNVSKIGYCLDWDIKKFDCKGTWQDTELEFEQDNETVSFNVTSFSAYAGFSALPEGVVVKLISNTEECIVNCEAVLDIYVPESLVNAREPQTKKLKLNKIAKKDSVLILEKNNALKEKKNLKKELVLNTENWLDTDLFDLWFLKTVESLGLEDFKVTKLVNITVDKTVFDYEPCGESPTTPGAKKICVKDSHIVKVNKSEWRDLLLDGLSAGHNIVKIEGKKIATVGENNVDWKISLNISNYQEPDLAWWNSSWAKKVPILVWGSGGSSPENYTMPMNITYDSDMQNDFDDLRFVDDDNTTELDYWIQEKSNGNWALVWVEIKDAINDSENQTIYMYYGNSGAISKSNISTTFLFGDDFNDNSIAVDWMNNTGPIYEENGIIFMNTSSGTDVAKLYINTTDGITSDFAVMVKVRPDYLDSDYRLGVAAKHNWDGSGDGYNVLIKYDNLSSVIFLDDWSAWGNEANPGFTFSTGNWYWFEMAVTMGMMWDNLYGRAWQVGSERPDWQITQQWSSRYGATAGINLGYLSYGSFDDFILRKYSGNEPFSYYINASQETAQIVVNASSPACTTGEAYYSTIQAAINTASTGATITVCPGTYTENVKVNKTGIKIVAFSSNLADTVVKPTSTSTDAFEITVNSTKISGFTVRDCRYCIYVNGPMWFTEISNLNITSANSNDIYLNQARNSTITNVAVYNTTSSGYGIYLSSAHNNIIDSCNINSTNNGIYLYYSDNNIINNSIIKSNANDGIFLHAGNDYNLINNNTINASGSGIYIYSTPGGDNNITNNVIVKATRGIMLEGGSLRSLVKNNTIFNASEYGIYISESQNSTFQENKINNSRYGIYLVGSSKWAFNHSIDTSNLVNGLPIYYYNSPSGGTTIDCALLNQAALANTNATAGDIGVITLYNVVGKAPLYLRNCNVSNQNELGNGIAVLYTTAVDTIVENVTSWGNQYTVYLEGTNYSDIVNVTSLGYKGIYLYQSSHNFIENVRLNTTASSGHGIYLSLSTNNTVRNNAVWVFNSNTNPLKIESGYSNNIIQNNFTSNSTASHGISISGSNNLLSYNNLNLTGGSTMGVSLNNANNNTIDSCNINSTNNGIYLYYSDNNIINNSIIKSGNDGINFQTGNDYNLIDNNTINASSSGIYIYSTPGGDNNITNNVIVKATRGIRLEGGSLRSLVKNNTIFNASEYGIYISESQNSTFQENKINNSRYGIYLVGSSKWAFNHSIDTSNLVNGLPIYYYNNYASNIDCNALNQNALSNVNVTAGDIGKITIANSQNIVLENCNISNENSLGNAIALVYSANITARNINSSNNQYTAYLEQTNYSNVSGITSLGYKGIYLYQSSHNFIENVRLNTTASSGGEGVYLYYANNNTIRNNDIRAINSGSSIYFYSQSNYNNVTNNNLTNYHSATYVIDLSSGNNYNYLSYNILNSTRCYGGFRLNSHNNTLNYNQIYVYDCGFNHQGIQVRNSDNIINNTLINMTNAYARGIGTESDPSRLLINNNTINILGANSYGIEFFGYTVDKNNITNNVIYVPSTSCRGLYLSGTVTNATIVNNVIEINLTNTASWAFYSDNVNNLKNTIINNTIKGDSNSSDTRVSFNYAGSIALKNIAISAKPSNPSSYINISKYLNITNLSANAWLFLNISYSDSDIAMVDEDSLFMARHNGTWETNTSKFASSYGLNADANYVYANITGFSIFAPLGTGKEGCIGEHYVFGCGDVVNESCVMNANLSASGTCFSIGADNIVIDCANYVINYSATEEGYGINNSDGFDNITIKNCTIKQTNSSLQGFNIFLNNSDNSIVEYSNFNRGKAGILVINSLNATIKHNYGSYFEYGEAIEWDACQPFNTTEPYKYYESGIWLVDSNNATIFNNTIQGNMSEEGMRNHNGTEAGITLCRSSYSNVSNNNIYATDTYGLMITNDLTYNVFYYNFVNGSSVYGTTNTNDGIILANSSNNNNISNNTFISCNEWGIFLSNSDSNLIRNNTANYNSEVGIRIGGTSSYNEIYDNIANYNGDSGLTINGNNNIAINNTFNSNMKGISFMDIYLDYCSNNVVKNVEIDSNYYGIYIDLNTLTGCKNNLVWDSNITNVSSNDVFVGALEGNQTFDLTFLNVSFNKSNVYISNDVESGTMYAKWYLDAYVNYSNGTDVEGANVLTWNNVGNLEFNETTNSSGYIERQNVTEYFENMTGKYFFTNYSVKAIKNPQSPLVQVNLTTNQQVNLTLDSSEPLIYFVSPTPQNNTINKSTENWAYINVTVEEDNEHGAYLDWNRSLRGYWKFNEVSGTIAEDNSSWNNDCVLLGDERWTSFSKRGNALGFDGVDDSVSCGNDASLSSTFRNHSFSIEAWVYFSDDSSDDRAIIEKQGFDVDEWLHILRRNNVALFGFYGDDLNGSTTLSSGEWWHLVFTWDASSRARKIYVNGVVDASDTSSGYLNVPSLTDFVIGSYGGGSYFNGTIDEVKVWNRVLSEQEINASYNNGLYRLERNFTGLTGGIYEYYACAEDETGNSNCTETRVLRINKLPTAPTLSLPENATHTTDRTPFFNWVEASDPDGDSLQYVWILHCDVSGLPESCSPQDERTVENITETNYTPTTNLKNFWDTQEYYLWKVKAWDGLEYGPESNVWQLYIDSLVALSMINATAAFGEMAPGTVNDTTDNAPWPISIQNDGNCYVNVSIFGTQLWQATPEINESYQYKFDYLELNSFNWSESVVNWANVPIGFTIKDVLSKFNYTDTNDSAELDIKLAPLDYEPGGIKSSNITLEGTFIDVNE